MKWLFPGDTVNNSIFHQDSASSHTAKLTHGHIEDINVRYIIPADWMTKSSDIIPKNVII